MLDMDLYSPIGLSPGESDDQLHELTVAALAESGPSAHPDAIPSNLEEMTPGPFLAAVLSSIDISQLTGQDVVTVLRAQQRQSSHHEAGVYAAMAETAHCIDADSTDRTRTLDEFAPEEIGAALTLTRRMANRELGIALDLMWKVPAVLESLSRGDIDDRKASLIVSNTAHLQDEQARHIVERILPDAPHRTTGQLAARLRRICIESDPESASVQYKNSLEERKVAAEPNVEGTASLVISECSPDDVYAARDHINMLARRLKTENETRSIDQLRADVALALLNGQMEGTGTRSGGVNITVDLTTLAQIDDRPGELAGYGPVMAEIARKVAEEQVDGEWTAAVTDPETGEPLHAVALRRRPTIKQLRKIRALHPSCTFPGCRMPVRNCDIDHIIEYAKGGKTLVANQLPLCRRHHMARHRRSWKHRKVGRTGVEWESPLGHRYRTGRPP